jgi:hypothetical protein
MDSKNKLRRKGQGMKAMKIKKTKAKNEGARNEEH